LIPQAASVVIVTIPLKDSFLNSSPIMSLDDSQEALMLKSGCVIKEKKRVFTK